MRSAILLVIFSLGCHRHAVEVPSTPDVATRDHWTAVSADESEIRAEWWESFRSKDLDQLIVSALEQNYDLKGASARLDAAALQARIAGADLWPSIGTGWTGRGSRQNFIGFPIPGSEGRVLSRTFSTWGISLDISWEADVWGRIAAGQLAAIADYHAAKADLRGAKLSLVAQASKAWFAAVEGLQQVDLTRGTVESYRETADRVRGRYEKGLQSSLDLRLALSSLASAEALLEQRKAQFDQGVRQLEILMGRYPAAAFAVAHELPGLPASPAVGIPSDLIARRPDLIAAERRLFATGARWTQARKELYPKFSLTGSLGTSASGTLEIFNGSFFVWSLLGNVVQPIFQGGRLRARIGLEDARVREAASQWANSVLLAFSEVETSLARERFLAEQERDLTQASEQAGASLRLAEDRYNSGLESFVTVLESQRRSLDAESQLLTVRRQMLDTRVDLHLALGGGFEEADADPDTEKEEAES